MQSGICSPPPGASLRLDELGEQGVEVKGYAYSGGGRGIVRVDVTADGGKSWVVARLLPEALAVAKDGEPARAACRPLSCVCASLALVHLT